MFLKSKFNRGKNYLSLWSIFANLLFLIIFIVYVTYYAYKYIDYLLKEPKTQHATIINNPNQLDTNKIDNQETKKTLVKVINVLDGDTIVVNFNNLNEKVRYIGIDCPESSQAWGSTATDRNKELVSDSVYIEFDVQQRDIYGRLLAYVYRSNKPDRMINEILVREGLCLVATYPPNVKYVERFTNAQKIARETNAGFWKYGGLSETPSEYRKRNRNFY